MMRFKINKTEITISEPKTIYKTEMTSTNNYVVISIRELGSNVSKQLYFAPKCYSSTRAERSFYRNNQIGANIDLTAIPHGTDDDCESNTMPLFQSAAADIDEKLSIHDKVLVNCNRGRSRSGTVIALYLMNYYNLSASDAIKVVSAAIKLRGYTSGGIDIKNSRGSYGDWLRNLELDSNKENSHNANLKRTNPTPFLYHTRAKTKFFKQASGSEQLHLPIVDIEDKGSLNHLSQGTLI